MGVSYASRISKVEAPTVGLLSTSTDPLAGPVEVVEAHRRLAAETSLRFVGNISGLDVPRGAADVVVCDGFTGQIIIQLLGGIGDSLMNAASQAWERRMSWRMGLRLLEDAVVRFHELITHNAYGGAPLLGFDQVAILALQSSDSAALQNAIKLAAKAHRENIPSVSARALSAGLP
jgi:glycerol-3-phosphate acyltransferase PlsX